RGGRIAQAELKNYKTEVAGDSAASNVMLFRDPSDGYSFQFNTAEQRINTADFNFTPVIEGDSVVWMTMEPAAGAQWAIRYRLRPDSYVVAMDIVQKGMDAILPASTSNIGFDWHQKMARNEVGRTFEERNSAIFYKYVGEGPDEMSASSDKTKSLSGRLRWVAFKNQFFSSVIIARDHFSTAELTSNVIHDDTYLKDMSMEASLPYSVADGAVASFDFYLGPNDYPTLSKLDDTLEVGEDLSLTNLIPLGWKFFRWINTLIIIPVFTFLGSFISSYGLIIFLLTVFIKLILFPFTFKSFKSQAKMRVLAPEIKEINEKYHNQEDALRRQQETMALYSRAGASPFSGCLPMLLQMPVLIAMFSFFPSAIELRGQSFLWAHDLSAPDYICTLPFSIPFYGNHVSLFCLLMTVVNVVYMHVSMQSQPTSAGMPGMKVMQYMMPVMFLFFFNDYAAALSYYYLMSLLITIIQTWIFRKCVNEDKVREQMLANARKPRKKSGWMARLEEAQRQQQAALRQQQQQQGNRRNRRQ
ncbi:MAG: membrane protein insertase YidC, partial [Muribaculaceae bacterium]|nr:membrane protein insertase YidC [Muribaculaceae bacterium]